MLWASTVIMALLLVSALLFHDRLAGGPRHSRMVVAPKALAVLPFQDLTEGMQNETYADDMTSALIGKLHNVPGLQLPSATAGSSLKSQPGTPAEIARKLGVAYVLDGNVRKAGGRLRVAAELVRADNGSVLWSETYDRPLDEFLKVQEDIAGDVSRTLAQSIDAQP